jgi:hypothetical protein
VLYETHLALQACIKAAWQSWWMMKMLELRTNKFIGIPYTGGRVVVFVNELRSDSIACETECSPILDSN